MMISIMPGNMLSAGAAYVTIWQMVTIFQQILNF